MIEREIYPKILEWINEEKILIVKGSRRVGKTILLKILQKDLGYIRIFACGKSCRV